MKTIRATWKGMWGANALQGQIFMISVGAAIVILDALIGNTINFDAYSKMATFLLILPLMLPALGIDVAKEGFAKFVLTFGTSFVFGGLPGLLVVNALKLDKTGGTKVLSSFSVTAAVALVIVMFLCYFQVGHLSRDFLYRTFNALKNPTVPPKLHYLLQALIFNCRGCAVRPIMEKLPARDLDALIGPLWYQGVVDPNSLWAQMVCELEQMSKDWTLMNKLLLQATVREALIEVVVWGGKHLELLLTPPYADIVAGSNVADHAQGVIDSIRRFTTESPVK